MVRVLFSAVALAWLWCLVRASPSPSLSTLPLDGYAYVLDLPQNITENGTVVKQILSLPNHGEFIQNGQLVTLRYQGYLSDENGTQGELFDSTDVGGDVRFIKGDGDLIGMIAGVEIGLGFMKPNERCRLTIQPELAYKESGISGVVPGMATVIYELHVTNVERPEPIDITGDGGVVKTTVRPAVKREGDAEDPVVIVVGNVVCVRYVARLDSGVVFEDTAETGDVYFMLGKKEVIDGIELAVGTMKRGERAKVAVSPDYAYGEDGSDNGRVPSGSAVTFDLTVVRVVDLTEEIAAATVEEERRKEVQDEIRKLNPDSDLLMLPPTESNLHMASKDNVDRDFAPQDDNKEERQLRQSRIWGRLHLDGAIPAMQYFRAHFGGNVPEGPIEFIVAEPLLGCEPVAPVGGGDDRGKVFLVMMRGVCTFSKKARAAAEAGAAGVVVVNTGDGAEHMPGPDAHDLTIASVQVPGAEGNMILRTLEHQRVTGRLVPVHCRETSEHIETTNFCEPATLAERRFAADIPEGGELTVLAPGGGARDDSSYERHEFLLANMGGPLPSTALSAVAAQPPDACGDGLANSDEIGGMRGDAAVVVVRGACSFLDKVRNVEAAGGRMMIVVNPDDTLVQMGAMPRWEGASVNISSACVGKTTGDELFAAMGQQNGAQISFDLSSSVRKATWERLSLLQTPSEWPRKKAEKIALFDEMFAETEGWPMRRRVLRDAFAVLNVGGGAAEL